jgi:hypothetical protein
MELVHKALTEYADDVSRLVQSATSREETYYPALRSLLAAVLSELKLSLDVRTSTSEQRGSGGADLPDMALYDGQGDFAAVFGEVKLPSQDIEELAQSVERDNQIGRYLAQTRAVLLCNIRAFALVTIAPDVPRDAPIAPEHRRIEDLVELRPSKSAMARGDAIGPDAAVRLMELIETAATRYAPIARPETLARILARLARKAKNDLPPEFTENVQGLLDDFAEALGIHFTDEEGERFLRSSLIQTAFYALFAAWALWHHRRTTAEFRWQDLGDYLTIPFLRGLFYEFRHPRRIAELRLSQHLDIATEALGRVDRNEFFRHFSFPDPRRRDDATSAILYFYEPFLEAFDPELRKKLGVWYTPGDIVRYQVRKIDQLLRQRLGCPRGFADEHVVVLDPCCGTGAYLIEVLGCIAEQYEREGAGDALGEKLLHAFCHRILGFEILTAPFVVAHLQLYMLLGRFGATPDEQHRPAVYLTNALTGWDEPQQLRLHFPELQEEHDAARSVKSDAQIIVVLGNPPYDRWAAIPVDEEQDLADHYKGIRRNAKGKQVGPTELYQRYGIRKQLLNDLYLRFFRIAERRIGEESNRGVVSFISNYSFISGRSHPLMRESLLAHFREIWIDSLNGDKYRTGKVIPDGLPGAGSADQSAFTTPFDPRGIQVGTAITTLLKTEGGEGAAPVHYRDFWGRSADKRRALLESLDWESWSADRRAEAIARPEGPRPYETFIPDEQRRFKLLPYESAGGYEEWPSLDQLFPESFQGINHNRGMTGGVLEIDRQALERRFTEYFSDLTFDELKERHPGICDEYAEYDAETTRDQLLANSAYDPDRLVPYVVFPLDKRWLFYETEYKLLNRPRPELRDNLENNQFLVTVPEPRQVSESLPLLISGAFDLHLHDRGSVGFPAAVRGTAEAASLFGAGSKPVRSPNIHPSALDALVQAWSLSIREPAQAIDFVVALQRFAVAVCHSPNYQEAHADMLSQDWAHIPIPRSADAFNRGAELGRAVATLLDPLIDGTTVVREILGDEAARIGVVRRVDGATAIDRRITYSYFAGARGRWEQRQYATDEPVRDQWGEVTGDLFLNPTTYLRNVPDAVWRFELGGYPVIKKWLAYRDTRRRGGPITVEELDHLASMVRRIAALIAIRERLDQLYDDCSADAFTAAELGCL